MTSLEMWSIFLQYADKTEYRETVERVAGVKEEIKMAMDALINVGQDERERAINRSRRIWRTDYESDMYTSREAGRIEGREEGRKGERYAIAKRLLEINLPISSITEATGLTATEIESLRLKH